MREQNNEYQLKIKELEHNINKHRKDSQDAADKVRLKVHLLFFFFSSSEVHISFSFFSSKPWTMGFSLNCFVLLFVLFLSPPGDSDAGGTWLDPVRARLLRSAKHLLRLQDQQPSWGGSTAEEAGGDHLQAGEEHQQEGDEHVEWGGGEGEGTGVDSVIEKLCPINLSILNIRLVLQYNDLMKKKRIVENDKEKILQTIKELDQKKNEALNLAWQKVCTCF